MVDAFNLKERCEICRYWRRFFEARRDGQCRKVHPSVSMAVGGVTTLFPVVNDNDWCGEFEKLVDEAERAETEKIKQLVSKGIADLMSKMGG
jgi:hypothetical protein